MHSKQWIGLLFLSLGLDAAAQKENFDYGASVPISGICFPYERAKRGDSDAWHAPAPVEASAIKGPLDEPHYGISGFGVLSQKGSDPLPSPGTLTIRWSAAQEARMDPATFRVYRMAPKSFDWELVGGKPDLTRRSITVPITVMGTYTIAPPLPIGEVKLVRQGGLVEATGLRMNNGERVPDGTLYVVVMSQTNAFPPAEYRDGVTEKDVDGLHTGVQVASRGGKLSIQINEVVLQRIAKARDSAKLIVYSLYGTAKGELPLKP